MPSDVKTYEDGSESAALRLLRLNYEYLLNSCPEHEKTEENQFRMKQIEQEIISVFWGLPRASRTKLSGQFRAFVKMRKNYRSAQNGV